MSEPLVYVGFRVSLEDYRFLQNYAEKEGLKISDVLRKAVKRLREERDRVVTLHESVIELSKRVESLEQKLDLIEKTIYDIANILGVKK